MRHQHGCFRSFYSTHTMPKEMRRARPSLLRNALHVLVATCHRCSTSESLLKRPSSRDPNGVLPLAGRPPRKPRRRIQRAAVSVRHCAGMQPHMADGEEWWSGPRCAGFAALLVPGAREEMASTGATCSSCSYSFAMEMGGGHPVPVAECSSTVISKEKDDSPVASAFHSVVFTCNQQDHELYTCNGSIDFRGNPASKKRTGKWGAAYSILGGEFCGAMAYYAVGTNLVSYLTKVQKQSNVTAASNIASWQGTCYLTPLLGAFLADSYWGRHRTIVISLIIFTMGMVLLTLSAVVPTNMHTGMISHEYLPSMGLFLIALGLGGMWPCVPTFGADQFDDTDGTEKLQKELYYNWYYFAVNGGFFVASTLLVWVQDNCGWGWGFGIPTLFSAAGIAGFLACVKLYRYQKPGGSALGRICQVVVAATRKLHVDVPDDSSVLYEMPGKESAIVGSRKLMHTDGLRFFDRAATITDSDKMSSNMPSPWKLCTVTQVEELKILARMLPVLLAGIIFNTAEAFFPLFVEQGEVMDNKIGGFSIPPATLTTFNCLCILILAPCYNKVLVPILSRITGVKKGLSELQRIGVGMFFAMLSLTSAALVEMARLEIAKKKGLVHRNSAVPMNILWQGPQYIFVGVAKIFTVVGYIEFSYEQSPDAMRSLCQACSLIMVTLGSYLVSITLKFINSVTGERGSHGWIPENLNEGRLDQFFWLMAGLQLLNVLAFAYCATRYKHKVANYGALLLD